MPINEFGAEVINGFVVIGSRWNDLRTARVIMAIRIDGAEIVTATAGKVGVKEWNNGHYFWDGNNDAITTRIEEAKADYNSRSIPPVTQSDIDEWFGGWRDAGYPYMGSEEHNRHILMADGRIRSIWTNDDGEFEYTDDDVIVTIEEAAESFHAWQYDY